MTILRAVMLFIGGLLAISAPLVNCGDWAGLLALICAVAVALAALSIGEVRGGLLERRRRFDVAYVAHRTAHRVLYLVDCGAAKLPQPEYEALWKVFEQASDYVGDCINEGIN